MSDREKKLIAFFAIAGFVVLNLLAYNFAKSMRADVDGKNRLAREQLAIAENFQQSREQIMDEMTWLTAHEPQPIADQEAQTQLQRELENGARNVGLTIKPGQKPLDTDKTGKNYHRAKIQIVVTGQEQALYRWFDQLNNPDQFRVTSQILLYPNQQNDKEIECRAVVEQWFVPIL